MASAEDEDRRMRFLAIALMCATMVCFTGQDTCANRTVRDVEFREIMIHVHCGDLKYV